MTRSHPTVTVTVVPVSRDVTLTAQLDVPTRQLAPVTMLQTQSALTTGHGHQNARAATGTLTFYNGQAAPQTIPIGTVFTGRDGVQVSTRADLTLPAANPPYLGQATVQASAIRAGSAGNIQAEDVNGTVSPALFVKNLVPFTGGSDARDFQAVAQTDLDSLTTTLKNALVQHIPQAYPLRPGETVTPTYCHSSIIADHGVGEEAMTITIKARYTCKGIAYSQDELQQRATAAFTTQTNPGANYELVSTTQPQVISLSPFTVRVSGTWVCVLVPGL